MRILFTVWGLPSHYLPMVPFGWACAAAGHDVRVAAQPSLTGVIDSSGLSPVPVGTDVDIASLFRRTLAPMQDDRSGRLTGLTHYRDAGRSVGNANAQAIYAEVVDAMLDDLADVAVRWRPDVVVWDPVTFAGPVVARHLGIPSVRHVWCPDVVRVLGIEDEWSDRFEAIFARYGVDPRRGLADLTIDPAPPSLGLGGAGRVCLRYVPYNGPGTAPRRLTGPPSSGRDRVCVTWGLSTSRITARGTFLVPDVVAALAARDVEVVVTVAAAERDLVGPVPDNVTVVAQVPLHTILPGCAAVVHQGSGGTTLTAARYGVPQVVLSQLHDQVFNGDRLAAAGAGVHLPARDADTGTIAAAVDRVLDEPARAAARRVREEMLALPSPAEVATRFEDVLSGRTRPGVVDGG